MTLISQLGFVLVLVGVCVCVCCVNVSFIANFSAIWYCGSFCERHDALSNRNMTYDHPLPITGGVAIAS